MSKYSLNTEKLLSFLHYKGWSLRQAARHMDIHHTYLSKVLNGVQDPGVKFICGALSTLKVPLEELFFLDHDVEERKRHVKSHYRQLNNSVSD